MGIFERLFDDSINDSEFLTYAKFVFSQITGRSIDKKVAMSINRLYKMYGRKGVISALVTLDVAVASGNFKLGDNYYPFLVYGAKKAFESHSSQLPNLDDIANNINRRKHK